MLNIKNLSELKNQYSNYESLYNNVLRIELNKLALRGLTTCSRSCKVLRTKAFVDEGFKLKNYLY